MANVTKKNIALSHAKVLGGKPYGNLSVLTYSLATNASGVWVDSDQATAVAINDVLRLGIIPKGTKIGIDYVNKVSTAFKTGTTGKVGFLYVDGVDSSAVPEDDDYFCAATTLAAAAVLRQTNVAVRPVTLPKDAYLTVTIAGAAQDAAAQLDISIIGVTDAA